MANLELSKHGGAHTTRGGDAEKKTEASFVRLDYATEDKETQKSKQTKSFRLLKSSQKSTITLSTCSTSQLANVPAQMQLCQMMIF